VMLIAPRRILLSLAVSLTCIVYVAIDLNAAVDKRMKFVRVVLMTIGKRRYGEAKWVCRANNSFCARFVPPALSESPQF